MAYGKAIEANDIVNGAAVVSTGDRTKVYDNTQRTQHLADATARFFTNVDARYRVHGGPGGSGAWEH